MPKLKATVWFTFRFGPGTKIQDRHYVRQDGTMTYFFNKEEMEKCKEERYSGIKECSFDIENLILDTSECFLIHKRIKPTSRRWKSYLRFIDSIVSEALLYTIAASIGYLLDQTDINKDITPLFALELELFNPDIIFRPSLDEKKMDNFHDFCKGILDDIYHMAVLVPRIAKVGFSGWKKTSNLGLINLLINLLINRTLRMGEVILT